MKITQFGRPELRVLREELDALLGKFAAERGISLKTGGIKFDATAVTIKVEGSIVTADGVVQSKERSAFARYCAIFGFKPEHLGATFKSGPTMYRITGLNPGAPRFPVLAERVYDGKGFKFPEESVKRALGITEPTKPAFDSELHGIDGAL